MNKSIENRIIDLYGAQGQWALPAAREREATRLLNIVDGLNFSGIIDCYIDDFYVRLLQMILISAHRQNMDMQAEHAWNEYERYHLDQDKE